jgi:hypothetical protein
MKIAHESPISIFPEVQKHTDYDYALVHLFEESPEYLQIFKDAIAAGREVILDNSIFELGEAFEAKEFAHWINELKPTWYIVPDSLENSPKTRANMFIWNRDWADRVAGKKIGVVQGKTYQEIKECYEYMDSLANVDMIAISFDYSYYTEIFPHKNKLVSWAMGRVLLLNRLLKDKVINTKMPHHLLGCGIPLEFAFYKDYKWIYSVDTSNPIVHGLKNIRYSDQGLWSKESQKLCTMIEAEVSPEQMEDILYNVQRFKQLANES